MSDPVRDPQVKAGASAPLASQAAAAGQSASRTGLTFEQRQELRRLIDVEQRKRMARGAPRLLGEERLGSSSSRYITYYWRHREEILARRKARKQAA